MRIVLGMGLLWGAYAIGFYGYALLRGYAVSFAGLVNPLKAWDGLWPPGPAGATEVIPTSGPGGSIPTGPAGQVG